MFNNIFSFHPILRFCIGALVILSISGASTYASDREKQVESVYSKYSVHLEKKGLNTKLTRLEKLQNKIDEIQTTKKLPEDVEVILATLESLNNDEILNTRLKQEKISFEQIYSTQNHLDRFSRKVWNDEAIFLENGTWYFYRYSSWASFPENTYRIIDLDHNKLYDTNTVVGWKDGKTIFIQDFEKIALIDDTIISGVRDKYSFLKEVKDDKRFLSGDTDNYFRSLRSDTEKLIGDETDPEKIIQKIYDFTLDRISYTQNLNLEDKKIFSGILSYQNRDGVCEGYAKLMAYMLGFAGIGDYEVIRGHVIDAEDFPTIGHAWVRVGEKYYDPTFDDPFGLSETRSFKDYVYYSLPEDLFYANRYHYEDTPDFLKEQSMEYRIRYINRRLALLVSKYNTQNYAILKPLELKKQLGINYNDAFDLAALKRYLPYYEVRENILYYDGVAQPATAYQYYNINNDNIAHILKQLSYDIDRAVLISLESGGYGLSYSFR